MGKKLKATHFLLSPLKLKNSNFTIWKKNFNKNPEFFNIYIYTLLVCLFDLFNKRQNRPTFCVEPHMTPGKVYGGSKLQKLASNKIWFSLNLKTFFVVVLQYIKRQNIHNWNIGWARSLVWCMIAYFKSLKTYTNFVPHEVQNRTYFRRKSSLLILPFSQIFLPNLPFLNLLRYSTI